MRRIQAYGPPPEDMGEESALAKLMGAHSLYTQEPLKLASYDIRKLKILRRNIQPQDIRTLLPKKVASYFLNYWELIEKSPAELEADDTSRLPAKPYRDPTLRGSRPLLLQFCTRCTPHPRR